MLQELDDLELLKPNSSVFSNSTGWVYRIAGGVGLLQQKSCRTFISCNLGSPCYRSLRTLSYCTEGPQLPLTPQVAPIVLLVSSDFCSKRVEKLSFASVRLTFAAKGQ